MGRIISTKRAGSEHLIVELLLNTEEALKLGGHTKDVYVITDKMEGEPARISLRGRKEATTYFLVPRRFRKSVRSPRGGKEVKCHHISFPEKTLFVYSVGQGRKGEAGWADVYWPGTDA